jgi:enoyl-CoA hydratase/carnithine racemase
MSDFGSYKQIGVDLDADSHVAVVEIQKPPYNFFNIEMIKEIAEAYEALDAENECRAIVLAAQGKAFCAGADFTDPNRNKVQRDQKPGGNPLYIEAVRLFRTSKPVVGAIQGAAVGGGLGLAMSPDFRVTCPEARFSANFTRQGYHPGFGLTVTLPEAIGRKNTELMFYTGRRFKGEESFKMGLAEVLVPREEVRSAAIALATEIAECSPLGVVACRNIMREGLADRVKVATDRELLEQGILRETQDFKEGTKAMAERRLATFIGA